MFVRIRWFIAGIVAAVGGMSFLASQLRKARQKLTPANLVIAGKRHAAYWIDAVADRIAPNGAGRAGR